MAKVNKHFLKMRQSYLFAEIAKRVDIYQLNHSQARLIRLGIGDVTLPLVPAVVQAMHSAADEMGDARTFHGYGPYEGYSFLRNKIAKCDYAARGVDIAPDEIFVSEGAKGDTASIGEIFGPDNTVAVCDPVYPVYVDANAMSGRAGDMNGVRWDKLVYMPCRRENHFLPELPEETVDMIYLCFPNNPTGEAISRQELQKWVDYANERGAVILYDGAYEAFISEAGLPHSIYEIPGAKTCAIEFRSFSKTAGFTGVRCGYAVIPKELTVEGTSLHALWTRRQSTKSNGVSYVTQRAAEAVYTDEGQRQITGSIAYYRKNAAVIREGLQACGFEVYGGVNAPYIWLKTPQELSSWDFFDLCLQKAGVIGTPGSGFGPNGEGFFRLTAFGSAENTEMAVSRIRECWG